MFYEQQSIILFILFVILFAENVTAGRVTRETTTTNCTSFIIGRKRWGARPATNIEYQIKPVKYVIIHHTVTDKCMTKRNCVQITTNIQSFHMDTLGYDDIGYNFLIGDNGKVYEGVGWHVVGAHTYTYNRKSIGIAFIGNFSDELPSDEAIKAAKKLLNCGVELNELKTNYILLGGRQIIASESPGLELYNEIQDWDHWSSAA